MKNKKSKAAHQNATPTGAGAYFQQIGRRIAALSTAQKIVAGLTLTTLGLNYLAKRRRNNATHPRRNGAAEAE